MDNIKVRNVESYEINTIPSASLNSIWNDFVVRDNSPRINISRYAISTRWQKTQIGSNNSARNGKMSEKQIQRFLNEIIKFDLEIIENLVDKMINIAASVPKKCFYYYIVR